MFSVFFQIIHADPGQEDNAFGEPYATRRRFCAFGFLPHLASQFSAGLAGSK